MKASQTTSVGYVLSIASASPFLFPATRRERSPTCMTYREEKGLDARPAERRRLSVADQAPGIDVVQPGKPSAVGSKEPSFDVEKTG